MSIDPEQLLDLLREGVQPRPQASIWKPAADLKATAASFTAFVDLPGIDEDEIGVRYQDNRLVISGNRDFDHDMEDAEEFTKLDRPYGPFCCEITLEGPVDPNGIVARYKRGVLKVLVPRVKAKIG